ncbi:MAG: hypothetical protein ACD_47C00125G0003 [uncultured bacterium]|nr:MAG: hypothetical protein ACD_47C00125G0003 [uncultured bacterium]
MDLDIFRVAFKDVLELAYCFIHAAFMRVCLSELVISFCYFAVELDDLPEFFDRLFERAFFFVGFTEFEQYLGVVGIDLERLDELVARVGYKVDLVVHHAELKTHFYVARLEFDDALVSLYGAVVVVLKVVKVAEFVEGVNTAVVELRDLPV